MNELVQKPLLKLIHDLNQPLTVMRIYLSGSLQRLQKDELSRDQLISLFQKMNDQSQLFETQFSSMQELIKEERTLDEECTTNRINGIIKEIATLFAFEIKQNDIALRFTLQNNPMPFFIHKFQLKQVLFRLFEKCINTVIKDNIQNPKLSIKTKLLSEEVQIILKCNFLITDDINYFLPKESGSLTSTILNDNFYLKLSMYNKKY